MAYPTDNVPLNRGTLPPSISNEIWADALKQSAIAALARKIDMPGNGVTVPQILGMPAGEMVAETAVKPVLNPTTDMVELVPKKIAGIMTFSKEFVRDLPKLYDGIRERAPEIIARGMDAYAFDYALQVSGYGNFHDAAATATGTESYEIIIDGIQAVAAAGYNCNGYAVSPAFHAALLTSLDGNGRPLFFATANESMADGVVFGGKVAAYAAPAGLSSDLPAVIGGDWNQCLYGIVEGIKISFSDQATVYDGSNSLNLWQRNMVGVLVEAEVAMAFNANAFFKNGYSS